MISSYKFLFKPEPGLEVVKLMFDLLNVKISSVSVYEEFSAHPNYPSLLSLSDVLTSHGIENIALKTEAANLDRLPVPMIAVVKLAHRESFTIVKSITPEFVEYYDLDKHSWQKISRNRFVDIWPSGVVLIADAENFSPEKDYRNNVQEEARGRLLKMMLYLLLPILVLLSGITAFLQFGMNAALPIVFSFLFLAGFIISGLLIWYDLDEYNPTLQRICSAGKKINCSAILNSNASQIFGISWSVIGFTYFTGGILVLIFSSIVNLQALSVLSWINVLSTPYIVFSVYYQWRVAKQWCVLCIIVQSILLLQLLTSVFAGWHQHFRTEGLFALAIVLLAAYSLPFVIATLILPLLRLAKDYKTNRRELLRLKHNEKIFEALLYKQRSLAEYPTGLGITLGNPEGKIKLIKVCNPYCAPCARAHTPIEKLLKNNPDLQVQIIFTATGEEDDRKTHPVRHLLAIAQKSSDEDIVRKALDDWYLPDEKDYHSFAAKYPMNGELKHQEQKILAMRDWCLKTEINFTPTFFINGFQLPEIYRAEDLKYFLNG